MCNNFYGVIGHLQIVEDGNFITNNQKEILLNTIKYNNFNAVSIDTQLNYGIDGIDPDILRKFIQQIKNIKPITIMVIIPINNNQWTHWLKHILCQLTDVIIIDLKMPNYLITKKEKIVILQSFYYINETKLIINNKFLDVEINMLKKYAKGLLINGGDNKDYGWDLVVVNGTNFIYDNKYDNHWGNCILFQKYSNLIHCTKMIGWPFLEALHSSIHFNHNPLKGQIIEKIKIIEEEIWNNPYGYEKFLLDQQNILNKILEKNNQLLF